MVGLNYAEKINIFIEEFNTLRAGVRYICTLKLA